MKKYVYAEAKKIIQGICAAAAAGEYDTREKFLDMLAAHPDIACQGYNAYGKIFFWNPASVQLYGYREDLAFNKELFELLLPPEMRHFAREMLLLAPKTGIMPAAMACDLLHRNGEYVTVFSGHLMFQWDEGSAPEFYCIDLGLTQPHHEGQPSRRTP